MSKNLRDTGIETNREIKIGEGDSHLYTDVLPNILADDLFDQIDKEVEWYSMMHHGGPVPRQIAIQASINEIDRTIPIYRHPADQQPPTVNWTPAVFKAKQALEHRLNLKINHCLIQRYDDGESNIREHADKTLDIERGTPVINYSLGATRTMVLRLKQHLKGEPRQSQRVRLDHNSVFVLGWETNRKWLHAIKPDKRMESLKSSGELRQGGQRISLTFRSIATFMKLDDGSLFGQGAPKTYNANESDALEMLKAFSRENHQSDFDWDLNYGQGFSSINFEFTD